MPKIDVFTARAATIHGVRTCLTVSLLLVLLASPSWAAVAPDACT